MATIEIRQYQDANARKPFAEWLNALRDRQGVKAILARLTRLQAGNRGDWKPVGAGVFELRVATGPGYRVYCGQDSETVLLLCGGKKRTQARDIRKAHDYWKDYQGRR